MSLTTTPIVTSAVAAASFVRASFNGRSGAGAISVPGLEVGDVVIWFALGASPPYEVADGQITSTYIEGVVSVADELQQVLTSDFSSVTYNIICLRGV